MTVREVWSQVSRSDCLREENVRHGGPVSGTLMALHDRRSLADMVVTDDVYVATELKPWSRWPARRKAV